MEKISLVLIIIGAVSFWVSIMIVSTKVDKNRKQIKKLKKELSILKNGNNAGS